MRERLALGRLHAQEIAGAPGCLRRADVLGVMGSLSTILDTDFGEEVFHELG